MCNSECDRMKEIEIEKEKEKEIEIEGYRERVGGRYGEIKRE